MRYRTYHPLFILLFLIGCLGPRQSTTTSAVSADQVKSEIQSKKASLASDSDVNLGYRRINQPDPVDLMDVAIIQLDNGLTVYLTENHEEPRFYAEVAVRVGAKNDPEDATGLAHYLEHLLFKGTQELGTIDYKREKPHLDRITQLYEQHY